MKKLFLTALMSVAITTLAAPPTFNVTAPIWSKAAFAKENVGVTIRKRPTPLTLQLMYDEAKIEDYDVELDYYAFWSPREPKGTLHRIVFDNGPVVSERHGWFEIRNIGPKRAENGWVVAKYCDVYPIEQIKPSNVNNTENMCWVNQGSGSNGTYAMYMETNEMNGTVDFYYGRLDKGFIVYPYHLRCEMYYTEDIRPGITTHDGILLFVFNKSMSGEIEGLPDIRKIDNAVLNSIIKNAKQRTPRVAYKVNGRVLLSN